MALFGKKDKIAIDLQTISTLISEGCIVDGNINAPAYVRIDGEVTGDITIAEGLIIGEKGLIKGNITTKELVVYGLVNGNLQVSSLEIKATGKINGEIKTQTLLVENGAIYNGNLSMESNVKYTDAVQVSKSHEKPVEV